MKHKKGMAQIIIISIIAIIALLSIAFVIAIKSGAPDIKSQFTSLKDGCNAPITPVAIQGQLNIADRALFGVEPEISSMNVISARPAIGETLGIASQEFDWKVELIDPLSGKPLDTEQGNQIQEGGSSVNQIPFVLYFTQPDNDCNGQIDDFKLIVRSEIDYDLLLESPAIISKEKVINYENGVLS